MPAGEDRGGGHAALGTRPPDLILLMTDQQRHDQCGLLDDTFETPRLDALATDGVRFELARSASTLCAPSRSSLMTGLLPPRVPHTPDGRALREGAFTVARALRSVGYQTALVGKMHFRPLRAEHGFEVHRTCENRTPLGLKMAGGDSDDYHRWLEAQGMAQANGTGKLLPMVVEARARAGHTAPFPFPAELHPTAWLAAEARGVLSERDPDRPLFLVVSFLHPHGPVNPPEPYASAFTPASSRLPADTASGNEALPPDYVRLFAEGESYDPDDAASADALRSHLAGVRALMRHIDDEIAGLLDLIDLDATTVFFTSDHGDYAGHRRARAKFPWIPFDDLLRVPLFAAGAGVSGGRTVVEPVSLCDLPATLLELGGVDLPDGSLDGASLAAVLAGGEALGDRDVLAAAPGWQMISRGDRKLIRHVRSDVLFDLTSDVHETRDLSRVPGEEALLADLGDELESRLAAPLPDLFELAGVERQPA